MNTPETISTTNMTYSRALVPRLSIRSPAVISIPTEMKNMAMKRLSIGSMLRCIS